MTRDRFTPAMDQVLGATRRSSAGFREQVPWDGNLGHLEGDIASVADDFRADLDQFFLEACQRPVFDGLGRRQRAQKVAEIVGERVKLETGRVGGERAA